MFSNYCGPGGKGKTQHQTDIECKKHDIAYEVALQLGGDPYWKYIKGDTDFLKKLISTPAKSFKEHDVKELSSIFAAVKHLLPGDQVKESKFELLEKDSNWQINYNGDTITMPNKKQRSGYFQSEASRLRRGERQARLSERFNEEFGHLRHTSPDDVSQGDRSSLPNIPPFPELEETKMEDIDEEQNVQSSSRSMGGSTMMTSAETPVTYATPNYQIQDTHTTVLPVTFYASGVLDSYTALDFTLRMNCIENPLVTLINDAPNNVTQEGVLLGATFQKGLYSRKIPRCTSFGPNYAQITVGALKGENSNNNYWNIGELPNGTRWPIQAYFFPSQITANFQPGMFQKDWYTKLYDFWTVLGCDYEIVMEVTHANSPLFNNDVIVATKIDTDSSTNAGDRIPDNMKLNDLKYVKGINFKHVSAPSSDQNKTTTISGTYKPGSAKGMVSNDGEIKKWTQTGVAQTYREDLHLMIFPHEFNNYNDTNVRAIRDSGTSTWEANTIELKTCVNMQITLKYLVQYKDLKAAYRYREIGFVPTPGTANDLLYSDYSTKRVVTATQ